MRDKALEQALQQRGAVKRIACSLGISTSAVSQWRRVPEDRLRKVAAILGVDAATLRPDLPTKRKNHRPTRGG